MANKVLDWGLFGSYGTGINNGMTVDTGGINVTVGFSAQDSGATATTQWTNQYVASGEDFDTCSSLHLYGQGGEGGVDNTSTTTLDFASSNALYADQVSDVSFRINDIDIGDYYDNHIDIVTVRAYDANGNLVPVTLTASGNQSISGNTATGTDYDNGGAISPGSQLGSVLVEVAGPVSRIEIDYDNGEMTDQSIWVTDVHFATLDAAELDGIVDGTASADLIDVAYTGDPEGDMIDNNDALLPGEAPQDDIVDAGAGNDTIISGQGDDDVYAGSGADYVDGGTGNDIIYGDSNYDGATGGMSTRESFEWDLAPDTNGSGAIEDQDPLAGFTQNTGNVDVTFSVTQQTGAAETEFSTDAQNVDGINTDGGPADDNSSLDSTLHGQGNQADYQLDFSTSVENVSFRVNDIDGDGVVRVRAFDAAGNPIVVNLTAGSNLTMYDTDGVAGVDTADSNGGYQPDTNPDYSLLVEIEGPVSRIVVEHDQDGTNNSGINLTDVFYDVPVVDNGPDGNDTLLGGEGDDIIYGEGGSDRLEGGAGDDTLEGGSGNDFILAGDGADLVSGDAGNDTLCGQDGDDTLMGGEGADLLEGMRDDDLVLGGAGNDTVLGDGGNDTLSGGEGADDIRGGSGRDLINGGNNGDVVDGGTAGDDYDTLDLSGQGPLRIVNQTLDADGDSTSGTVEFLDNNGNVTGTMTFTEIENIILPPNIGPVANDDTATTDEDTPVTIDVLSNDTDLEGDTLSIDGTPTANNGTVTVNPDGTLEYTPDADFNGTDTITYTITDGNGGTDTAQVTVTVDPVNDGPVANDDAITLSEDEIAGDIEGNVLSNDTDPENDSLSVGAVEGAAGNVGAAVAGDNGGLITINSDGSYGFDANGEFETLAVGETATTSVEYTVDDGNGGTDTATLTITVEGANDAPDAQDDIASTDYETPVVVDILANDTDVDGDAVSLVGVPTSADGTVEVNPDGTITFTPNAGFDGDATIDYEITDPHGATDTAQVTVTVAPNPLDGIVEGTGGNDTIDYGYTGDPEGDRVDHEDEILPGEETNDDIIEAYEGDDLVDAGLGNDEVDAGSGNDTVHGGAGNDEIDGGTGNDVLNGDEGNDTILGGEGNDLIDAGNNDPLNDHVTFLGVPVDGDPNDDRDFVDGGTGHDTITTGDDADTIYGGIGNDSIDAGIDDDEVYGGDGDDFIDGSLGNDLIEGGDGNDTIEAGIDAFSDYVGDDPNLPFPGALNPDGTPALSDPNTNDGRDTVFGGRGHDVIITGDDADYIDGGSDDDTIHAGIDDDYVDGGTGNDSIIGGHGSDEIYGNDGDDWINAGDSALLWGQAPDDTDPVPENGLDFVDGGAGNDTIFGQDDDDTLLGGTGDDLIDGGIDDDLIDGGEGHDSLLGGDGNDTILGGAGNDTIDGGRNADSIDGGAGHDVLTGGNGSDTLMGGDGDDVIDGGTGGDLLSGDAGHDTILGSSGRDTIDGGSGDDVINASLGEDLVYGGEGHDSIEAGPEGDTIYGDEGNDTIRGFNGADELYGGDDRDTFLGGSDGDFVDGNEGGDDFDTLDLTGSAPMGGSLNVIYEANPENGTVEYRDAAGNITGSFTFQNIENVIPCFTPGTTIATPKGERLVEELQVGDRIITRDNGLQEIRWIGAKPLTGVELAQNTHLKPILIREGALGNGLPERDMLVSPNHRVLVNNEKTALYFEEREVLAAAKHLVGADGIQELDVMGTTYIHFMFDNHEVVLSNGAWTESFQPGDYTLQGIGNAQRNEIFELFPELKTTEGLSDYQSARRSLKAHEAKLLVR